MANEQSALELSDEDFGKLSDPVDPEPESNIGEDNDGQKEEESNEENANEKETTEDVETEETSTNEEEPDTIEPGNLDESTAIPAAKSKEFATDDVSTEQEQPEPTLEKSEKTDTDSSEEANATSEVDYKAAYEGALAPLAANGKQIQLKSIEDLRKLASKGANYTKKMVALKPNLKLLKMLENNGLLDESKLSYLIDLDKKNPGAVHKFIKESGVDPLEVDVEKDTDYTPNTYPVNDEQLQLDSVLDDIRDTPSYNETIDIVGNKWDESSKQILLKNPNIITAINGHVQSGIYKQINEVVEHERMLGNLSGLSDLDAYKQIGDAMQAQGAFNEEPSPVANKSITPVLKAKDDPKLKEKKRAASSTKGGKSTSKKEDFNPLAMSDEDFEKATANSFL